MAKKSGLGKGLDALFVDNSVESDDSVVTVRLTEIEANKDQPRKYFDDEKLGELCDSIREHGVLSPLIVRPQSNGGYRIIAGERRFRASRMAGLTEVPVIVRELSDSEAMEIALIENLQREDLNVVEEALGYKALMDEHSLTQDEVSKKVGKSRSEVANTLRLLKLPKKVLDSAAEGKISKGHARALLALDDEDAVMEALEGILSKGLSVRDIERMGAKKKPEKSKEKKHGAVMNETDKYITELELSLNEALGRKVKITKQGEGGTVSLDFYSKDDLETLVRFFSEEKL